MTIDRATAVADAVLFGTRGPQAANPRCCHFGVLAPPGAASGRPRHAHTECVVEACAETVVVFGARFLRGFPRKAGGGTGAPAAGREASDHRTGVATVHEVAAAIPLGGAACGRAVRFTVPDEAGRDNGYGRTSEHVTGLLTATSTPLSSGLVRVAVHVENRTPWHAAAKPAGSELRFSLVATHTVLTVEHGAFVSLLDPPERAGRAAKSCRNKHAWPVLIGRPDERGLMLSSPLILPDHPEAAPEPPVSPSGTPGPGVVAPPPTMGAERPTSVGGVPVDALDRVRRTLGHFDDAVGWSSAGQPTVVTSPRG